jgi:alpha-galactosidase
MSDGDVAAVRRALLAVVVITNSACVFVDGIDNGLGLTPPRGWRSWNCFASGITQERMLQQVDALVNRSRLVDGNPTSLLDLGYVSVGLDDAWQACGTGINGSFHDKDGNPLVNLAAFPNLTAMNTYAHSKGVKSGWCEWSFICRPTLHCLHTQNTSSLTKPAACICAQI